MIIQVEVTNEEAAFIGHLLDLADEEDLSQTIRLAPGFLFQYATSVLAALQQKWVVDLFSDAELERLLCLWPVVYNTPAPMVADLRGELNEVDFSSLDT